ncbi:unnamed protein product [Microthlaspi erraticum]|uniref:Uncharacterized protein n=1 Tax=Microthlaspi erraticum TaxID=1685480 RepID=A0A6D2HW99_9BRAS|nr:unnamed protein product [Microthlaspi erraticum]
MEQWDDDTSYLEMIRMVSTSEEAIPAATWDEIVLDQSSVSTQLLIMDCDVFFVRDGLSSKPRQIVMLTGLVYVFRSSRGCYKPCDRSTSTTATNTRTLLFLRQREDKAVSRTEILILKHDGDETLRKRKRTKPSSKGKRRMEQWDDDTSYLEMIRMVSTSEEATPAATWDEIVLDQSSVSTQLLIMDCDVFFVRDGLSSKPRQIVTLTGLVYVFRSSRGCYNDQ